MMDKTKHDSVLEDGHITNSNTVGFCEQVRKERIAFGWATKLVWYIQSFLLNYVKYNSAA